MNASCGSEKAGAGDPGTKVGTRCRDPQVGLAGFLLGDWKVASLCSPGKGHLFLKNGLERTF